MNNFFMNKLSKCQCGFRKGFGTQHCLLVMIEKLQKIRDNKMVFAVVFTDLSRDFNCISHELKCIRIWCKVTEFYLTLSHWSETKNKDRLQFQWLSEYSFWCSIRINTRSSSFHHLHMSFIYGIWRDRICYLCRWCHPLYLWTKFR